MKIVFRNTMGPMNLNITAWHLQEVLLFDLRFDIQIDAVKFVDDGPQFFSGNQVELHYRVINPDLRVDDLEIAIRTAFSHYAHLKLIELVLPLENFQYQPS